MLLLLLTPHPPAVAYQYLLGARGYWATGKDFLRVTGLVALVIPPWLIAMSAISIILSGRRHIPLALPALAVVLWWFFFNAVISYTLDPRIISAAMPVAVVGALLAIVRSRRLTAAATVFAALTFALALGSASGDLPGTSRRFAAIFTPLVDPQEPPAEVGLLNVARQINQVITAAGRTKTTPIAPNASCWSPPTTSSKTPPCTSPSALRTATPTSSSTPIPGAQENFRIDPPPSFSGVLNFEWFLTKQRRKEPAINPLQGDVFVPLYAVDALILAPESPLHGCFEKQCELPIRQMNNFEDTVTLWRLKEVPPAEKLLAALRFVQPRFKGTRGEQAIADQIARLAATGPGAPAMNRSRSYPSSRAWWIWPILGVYALLLGGWLGLGAWFWEDFTDNSRSERIFGQIVMVVFLLFAESALLFVPIQYVRRRPITRATIWVPVIATGFFAAALFAGGAGPSSNSSGRKSITISCSGRPRSCGRFGRSFFISSPAAGAAPPLA